MTAKKKLFIAAALLGISLTSSLATSAPLRYCDTACPTADGLCNCPLWTDKPKAQVFCATWNRVHRAGCWYE